MKKIFSMLCGVFFYLFLIGSASGAVIQIAPSVDEGYQRDYNSGGVFEWYDNNSNYESVGVRSDFGTYKETRMALEFDLGAIPDGADIISASFSIGIVSYGGLSSSQAWNEIMLSVYAGNGSLESDDFLNISDNIAGPFLWSSPNNYTDVNPIVSDTTAQVQSFFANGQDAGFLLWDLRAENGIFPYRVSHSVSFYSVDVGSDNDRMPMLTIEYTDENGSGHDPVPEPATMTLFCLGLLGLAGVSRRKK